MENCIVKTYIAGFVFIECKVCSNFTNCGCRKCSLCRFCHNEGLGQWNKLLDQKVDITFEEHIENMIIAQKLIEMG